MTKVIIPDVSRHVHFIPDEADRGLMIQLGSQPLHAVVIYVHNERSVNLAITDHDGFFYTRFGITLVQPGDELPGGSYCRWMPHQVNQAAAAPASTETAPDTKGDGSLSGVVADLLETTATSLKPSDLAGIEARGATEGSEA